MFGFESLEVQHPQWYCCKHLVHFVPSLSTKHLHIGHFSSSMWSPERLFKQPPRMVLYIECRIAFSLHAPVKGLPLINCNAYQQTSTPQLLRSVCKVCGGDSIAKPDKPNLAFKIWGINTESNWTNLLSTFTFCNGSR